MCRGELLMDGFEVILFDIGGVIVELAGALKLIEWINKKDTIEELNKKWNLSAAVYNFETGQTSSDEFAKELVNELRLSVSAKKFIEEFELFTKCPFEGAMELLTELSKEFYIASFSNTNALQWNRLCREYQIEDAFHKNFLSFRIGLMKPQKEAYYHVIKELGCKPNKIIFFDDNQLNVDVASELGIKAYKVVGIKELTSKLQELQVLKREAV
jgi:putative hydrolase of the HAD superfamily